ncbi:MAG TPA: TonB-dependent receptor [Opitutaceae bacterium]|nr:TonB-dependent receptor [Opitutaceae bacterium]
MNFHVFRCGRVAFAGGLMLSGAAAQTSTPVVEPPAGETIALDPFTISSEAEDGYFSNSTSAFGRVVMKLENVPQKLEVYNAQFIADIVPTSITDITRYSSAVNYNNSERNNGSTSLVRGFSASVRRNGENLGDLVGLAAVETIEQAEVVKGPSAVLYGASQPGGVINYVTKTPKFRRETAITGQLHSFGGYTATIDTTGPLGSADRKGGPIAAYRFVVVNEDRKEYQDNDDFFERKVFFGKILFRPVPWASFTLEAEKNELKAAFFNSQLPLQSDYTASRSAPYSTTVPNPALVREPFFLPVSWTYQTNDTYRDDNADIYQATVTIDRDLGRLGRWTLRSFYSLFETDTERVLVDIPNTAYPRPVTSADLGKVVNRDQQVTAADIASGRLWLPQRSLRLINDVSARSARNQFDLTGQFETGPVKHTFLAGTELSLGSKSRYAPFGGALPGGTSRFAYEGAAGTPWATWVDSPDYRPIPINWNDVRTTSNPTGAVRLQAPTTSVPQDNIAFDVPFLTEKPNTYYFFDGLSLLEERLQISLGLRHDDVRQEYRDAANVTQTATASQWTKRFGVVYKIQPWVHVYGLYNESFNPNGTGALNAWRMALAPQDGKQKEAGLRFFLWEERLSIDVSYFQISNKNVYQSDPFGKLPTRFPPGTDLTTIPDTVLWPNTPGLENKGIDLDVKLRLSRDSQLIAAYTNNDMKATGTITQQEALGSATYPVNNVPEHQFSVWSKWTPSSGSLRGFNFSLGYRYVGERLGGPVGNVGQIALSAYSMVDASIGYRYKQWSTNLAVRNVLDEYAFRTASGADRIYPEKPLHAILSVTVKL